MKPARTPEQKISSDRKEKEDKGNMDNWNNNDTNHDTQQNEYGQSNQNSGYDSQGYNNQGYDSQGYNNQGYDNQGYNYQGYDSQGYDNQGYNNQGYNAQGYNNQGYNTQGFSNPNYAGGSYQNPYNQQEEKEAPVKMGEWALLVGMLVLVPCVGFIMAIVFAFSKKEKKSMSNFCKVYLIFSLISLAIGMVIYIVYGSIIIAALSAM